MRCTWCDSEYTFYGGSKVEFDEIFRRLEEFGCNLVEITGGEPLAQKNVYQFISVLCDKGYQVLIETGGFFSTENVDPRALIILDVKCPSSGEADRNHWTNLERLRADKDEVKFVVGDLADLEFAYKVIDEYSLEKKAHAVLISPVFNTPNLREITESVANSGRKLRLNLQLHTFIWGENARGV